MMKFGIWEFDANFGLVGKLENFSEYYISTAKIWETEDTTLGKVWKWPVFFATQSWATPAIADDFNKAFFYAQNYFESQRPVELENSFEFDARTIDVQAGILRDFFEDSYGSLEPAQVS